ncbi:MAG TPA: hypothetical protein VEF03_04705 [Candidatus Binataceae bacterium]|nr:hypothetical protein [Candidatus Binataceae bacterium]
MPSRSAIAAAAATTDSRVSPALIPISGDKTYDFGGDGFEHLDMWIVPGTGHHELPAVEAFSYKIGFRLGIGEIRICRAHDNKHGT